MVSSEGHVFIVGAGPGDPGLITQKGKELLRSADVIVMDALVNPILIRNVRAQIIYAGKRGPAAPSGSPKSIPQAKINQLLIRLARRKKFVVRLKGGDPYVFGRGAEEVEALRDAGVPCTVIPGVTSAIAVPEVVGIPVTDRRYSSSVTFITGREGKEPSEKSRIEWNRLSPRGTLVVMMGVSEWPMIRRRLLANGWPSATPVAAVQSGTWAAQRVIATTLNKSEVEFRQAKLASPAVIVLGGVVRLLRAPLKGRRVVVTRSVDQNQSLASELTKKGALVIACPVIKIKPLKARGKIGLADEIIFLSANGVESFVRYCGNQRASFRKIPVIAVGPKTAARAQQFGFRVRKTAQVFNSDGILAILGRVRNKRFLIPRVQNGPDDFIRLLRKKGAAVNVIETYQTLQLKPSGAVRRRILSGVDAVTFTSASTVRHFFSSFTKREIRKIFATARALSIGPITTGALRSAGVKRIVESKQATVEDMADSLEAEFRKGAF